MASEASWQTSTAAKTDGSFAEDQRTGNGTNWNKPLYEPLDQHMIEGLLQRLVDRFEESERLYGEAIEELNARLDRLSKNSETPEPAATDTFDRLHAQVRDLAQRFEPKSPTPLEAPTPLENFERLGKALTGRGDLDDSHTAPAQAEPEPSPFAKSLKAFETPHIAPALNLEEEYEPPAFTPTDTAQTPSPLEAGPLFDKQLVEMAAKLERSIDMAMPTGAIDALNARLDVIGQGIAQAVDSAPDRSALEHVESHIAGIGRQLAHAETQLNKIESVEDHLRKLIVRLDEKDADQDPARIVAQQAQDIAAKAAGNAARLVADDRKKTTERLDAMQRELAAIGQTNRISGDKVISTLEAVNAQLNRLAEQVEGATLSGPKSHLPFGNETKSPLAPARPNNSPPVAISEDPKPVGEEDGSQTKVATTAEQPRPMTPVFKETEANTPAGREERPDDVLLNAAPDDLVAAARQAAQAAAARAQERAEERSKRSSGRPAHNEQTASRWRPLLIVTAAGLLVVSAVLLYGRLDTKTEPAQSPAADTRAAPSATTPKLPGQSGDTAVPKSPKPFPAKEPAPAKNRQPSTPDAGSSPASGAAGQANPIEVGQTSDRPAHRLASGIALPPGISLSTGDLSERASTPRVRKQ